MLSSIPNYGDDDGAKKEIWNPEPERRAEREVTHREGEESVQQGEAFFEQACCLRHWGEYARTRLKRP